MFYIYGKNKTFMLVAKNYYTLTPLLVKAWGEFERSGIAVSPFLHLDYIRNICRQVRILDVWRGAIPVFCCVESAKGGILLIAPLVKLMFVSSYRMLADIRGCGSSDFLYHPKLTQEERLECLKILFEKIGKKWHLRRIPAGSVLNVFLEKRMRSVRTIKCCRIPVAEYETWFASLSSSVRQNVRTAYNRLKRDGHLFELSIVGKAAICSEASEEEFGRVKEESLELYIKRQITKYQKVGLLSILIKKFAYNFLKHDSKSLYYNSNSITVVLRVDGKVAAYMGCLLSHDGKHIVVPRLAIDDQYKFYSPGYVMLCELLKYLSLNTQVEMLDLSRGVEKYKTDLGGQVYETLNMKS